MPNKAEISVELARITAAALTESLALAIETTERKWLLRCVILIFYPALVVKFSSFWHCGAF